MYKTFYLLIIIIIVACSNNERKNNLQETQKPNIIWIYADDHDQRAISAYGSHLVKTPNIDRIAREGMIFNNSFVTNSICSPGRAVLLTGKHSHLNGVSDNKTPFDGGQQTFPKLLQQAGYETALVGKWHLHTKPTGFNHWNILPGQGKYYDPAFIKNGDTITTNGYVTDLITDFALEYLEEIRNESKPFCLLLHNKAPHSPWMPAPRHFNLFQNDTFPVPATFFDDCQVKGTAACDQNLEIYNNFSEKKTLWKMFDKKGDQIITDGWLKSLYMRLNEEEKAAFEEAYLSVNREFLDLEAGKKETAIMMYQRYIKDYLRCVVAIDENVGRLLQYLDQNNIAENTVIFYSSDQGFYLGDFGWYDKRFMYDISMRTPLMARWPGIIEAGSATDEMVQNLDMAETFLDIGNVKIPGDMQGLSLLPLIKRETQTLPRKALYYHYNDYPNNHNIYPHFGIRTSQHKLIHFYTINEWEFYDLAEDPEELKNQINNSHYQQNVRELKKQLSALQKQYGEEL